MRGFLLSQGSDIETVNSLSERDFYILWEMLRSGLIGFTKDYVLAYHEYKHSHDIQQLLISRLNPKHRIEKENEFNDVFPHVFDVLSFGKGKEISEMIKREEVNKKLQSLKGKKAKTDINKAGG